MNPEVSVFGVFYAIDPCLRVNRLSNHEPDRART